MREMLSKSTKTKLAKLKSKVAAAATRSTSRSITKTKASSTGQAKGTTAKRIKTPSIKISKNARPVKKSASAKPVKPAKVAKPLKAALAKTKAAVKKASSKKGSVAPRVKARSKAGAKMIPKAGGITKNARTAARPSAIPSTKIRPKKRGKVTLPLVVAPPPLPPEPPRRQMSSGVLRAFEQAVKVFNRRNYEDAKPMFENLQTRFPNDVEIIATAQTYIQVCNQKLAHAQTNPRNAEELYDRGVFALNIGDFSQARTFFEKALRLRPDEAHLLYSLAATHAQTGSHEQALDYLKRSIQIQPRFRAQALNDSDFSMLRENKRFLELLGLTSPFERLESRR